MSAAMLVGIPGRAIIEYNHTTFSQSGRHTSVMLAASSSHDINSLTDE
jgi:hypothetical protein